MPQNKTSLPSQAILKGFAKLKYSDPLYKAEYKFSLHTEECLTFQPVFPVYPNILPNRLNYSVPLHKTEDKFSLLTMDSLTFKPIPQRPYNVSSRAFADILSASLSVYFTSIGRYFFSSFTFPEDLAISTTFFIAVRSSGLIFNTLL